ncbi:ABC transporter ATP-binding protein [Alicyclobacillus sp. ALC3]|uniref:ABC transporter ATP-binding protein n=1 Tax=Alicyclobacillus sp. ALC3 TaxID=2796143 RepID=UPI0023783580|nr:ABC transporter ATP-binding protein [Alicyclobacillus sp. ALC3]WDL97645.1 ABC transporter ATP-binding protein [Alicyclobacillus sp. ALC3]
MSNALETLDLTVTYGPVSAVQEVSVALGEGQLVTILGPNGAGKTSILRALTGLERIRSGRVRLFGTDVAGKPAHWLVRNGLIHVPERRRIFGRMSVKENLELGAFTYYRNRAEREKHLKEVLSLFPRLEERLKQLGGMLSGGEQQMLAIGRALMARPRVLLLDEPSLGLSPQMTNTIYQTIRSIALQGTSVLLVEQNAHLALKVAHYAYLLRSGTVVAEGRAEEFRDEAKLASAYLGGEHA